MRKPDYAEDAERAYKDLNMFEAVVALCEHSLFSSDSHGAESRIINICRAEQQKCLRRYDRAKARSASKTGETR